MSTHLPDPSGGCPFLISTLGGGVGRGVGEGVGEGVGDGEGFGGGPQPSNAKAANAITDASWRVPKPIAVVGAK